MVMSRTIDARNKKALQLNTLRARFRKAQRYRELVPVVAKRLGLDRSHVYRVLQGYRSSVVVEEELLREFRNIENEQDSAA